MLMYQLYVALSLFHAHTIHKTGIFTYIWYFALHGCYGNLKGPPPPIPLGDFRRDSTSIHMADDSLGVYFKWQCTLLTLQYVFWEM